VSVPVRIDTAALFVEAARVNRAGDTRRAFRLWLACAQAGDRGCQLNVGYCYQRGEGVHRNAAKAIYWYRRAYRGGEASAANNLGLLYRERGELRRAIAWLGRAVQRGSIDSALHLGEIYLEERRNVNRARQYLTLVSRSSRVTEGSQEHARQLLKDIATSSKTRQSRRERQAR
jgi:TPR repeat protein